jgi:hypothetical protein
MYSIVTPVAQHLGSFPVAIMAVLMALLYLLAEAAAALPSRRGTRDL